MNIKKHHTPFVLGVFVSGVVVSSFMLVPTFFATTYNGDPIENNIEEKKDLVTHIRPREPTKGIYMSSWAGGNASLRTRLVSLADETEINAIVLDIKDYTGKIAFEVRDPELVKIGSSEVRISDIDEFIKMLHEKNIYVIGRVAVFQDPYMVKRFPEHAVKRESDKGVWKDYKGISWIDPGSRDMWEYIARIGEEAYSRGFDEINFDYVRFPSDGNMKDIYYPWSNGKVKKDVMASFFSFLHDRMSAQDIPMSIDLFGMTTTNTDDLNIGQVLEDGLLFSDYVLPMVYPSHYPPNFNGYANPSEKPYEVIKFSMDKAVERAHHASTSPLKLRPWLQDFNLGAVYTKDMVRTQIQATYDAGLSSWFLWNAANRYTKEALLPE